MENAKFNDLMLSLSFIKYNSKQELIKNKNFNEISYNNELKLISEHNNAFPKLSKFYQFVEDGYNDEDKVGL
jgi:hypothetical protein